MNKKIIIAVLFIIFIGIAGFGIYLYIIDNPDLWNKNNNNQNNQTDINNTNNNTPDKVLELNTVDNSQVIKTNSNSTIRVINYYDRTMFEGKNTILFMWASWCPNCATEFDALNEILKKYKNNENLNIVFIAHEYLQDDGNINSLLDFLEGGTVDYDTEILLDFGRVIRSAIDPGEGYIPRTYFLDKNCNVLKELEDATTVEEIDNLISELYNI